MDLDLEPRLELLKDDRQRYENVTKLAQTLANQLAQFTDTQKTLGDAFSDLSIKTPTLHVSLKLRPANQSSATWFLAGFCVWFVQVVLPYCSGGHDGVA